MLWLLTYMTQPEVKLKVWLGRKTCSLYCRQFGRF